MTMDPRLTPARPQIAAAHLRGKVEAERFVEGQPCQVIASAAPLRREPRIEAPLDTEALFGEPVMVYDIEGQWAWVQLQTDGYVGWLPAAALSPHIETPTHVITAVRTFIYPDPTIKAPPAMWLSMNSYVSCEAHDERFLKLTRGGYVIKKDCIEKGNFATDPVALAEKFLETPYLWGGKTSMGLDCSGLTQVVNSRCGIFLPRDSDMQEANIAKDRKAEDPTTWERGDLVFWKGHVAMVRDNQTLIHANAHAMKVSIENTQEALERIAAKEGAVRRVLSLTNLGCAGS